ncbi:hypothetical protein TNCV_3164111 [Trichonephila clavipes]|nr:hypothetical protein TNCV_3164111 [Trichonephila clavipes]
MKNHSHASRIPSFDQSPSCHSAGCKPPLSPCPASKTCRDMRLRTVLESRCPKRNAYSTPIHGRRRSTDLLGAGRSKFITRKFDKFQFTWAPGRPHQAPNG